MGRQWMDIVRKYHKILLFIGIAGLIIWLDISLGLSRALAQPEKLLVLQQALLDNQFKAILFYIGLTILGSTILAMPGIVFAVAAGVLFGPLWGTLACSIATTIGASISFLAGRYFLHDAVKPMAMKNRHIRRLFFEGPRQNAIILLMITRLIPLFPFNLQNYAYGITDISYWTFTFYSMIFMLPGTAVYVIAAAGILDQTNRTFYLVLAGMLLVIVSAVSFYLRKRHFEKTASLPDPIDSHSDDNLSQGSK